MDEIERDQCSNCAFWFTNELFFNRGVCKRYPPKTDYRTQSWKSSWIGGRITSEPKDWPLDENNRRIIPRLYNYTEQDDWCGEHRRIDGLESKPSKG